MAAWMYGRWRNEAARILAVLLVLAMVLWSMPGKQATGSIKNKEDNAYSQAKVEQLVKSGQPVFVDFTAAWCVTCRVNKVVAFTPEVRARMKALGVILMQADWTNADPEITRALAEFGRDGVPLYLLYPGKGARPHILPQLLTPRIIMDALEKVR
jgi:thiol:disulfide interchange protein DsbD